MDSVVKNLGGRRRVLAGQPLLRKRFVMDGAAVGTSFASKYLSAALPQKMPIRMLGTRVLGRAVGRGVPLLGWALLAIDVVELTIQTFDESSLGVLTDGRGDGGPFGGAGASGTW